jgi:hypothetical protein
MVPSKPHFNGASGACCCWVDCGVVSVGLQQLPALCITISNPQAVPHSPVLLWLSVCAVLCPQAPAGQPPNVWRRLPEELRITNLSDDDDEDVVVA